jgi:hypothetical protein
MVSQYYCFPLCIIFVFHPPERRYIEVLLYTCINIGATNLHILMYPYRRILPEAQIIYCHMVGYLLANELKRIGKQDVVA